MLSSNQEFRPFVLSLIQKLLDLESIDFDLNVSFGALGFNSLLLTEFATALTMNPAHLYGFKTVQDFIDQHETHYNQKLMPEKASIIGFSARLPACADLEVFWQKIVNQEDVISQTPNFRHDFMQSHYGAFLDKIDEFDPLFFNISATEAKAMDPQQRLLLQEVWLALKMANLDLKSLEGSATGVYVGASSFDYAKLLVRNAIDRPFCTMHGGLANRISYYFDFCGPSEVIDTACSSGLYALDRAVKAIVQGEIDQAVVCGVNLLLDDEGFYSFKQSGLSSPTHQCRPFDRQANGYIRGEGIVALVLRKESLAKRHNNAIYARVLAIGANHSGKTNAYTSPSPKAQQALYERLYETIDLNRLSYVETHGSGTLLGDAIEIEGWKKFIKDKSLDIKLGSVKGNIGHLESASGLAGLIKLLLMFHYKVLPGQAHLKQLNAYLQLENTGLSLCQENQNWPQKTHPFMAGLSAFGIGGVNVHAVIEQGSALFGEYPLHKPSFPFQCKSYWFKTQPRSAGLKATLVSTMEAMNEYGERTQESSLLVFIKAEQQAWVKSLFVDTERSQATYYVIVDDKQQFEQALNSLSEQSSLRIDYFAAMDDSQSEAVEHFLTLIKALAFFPKLSLFLYQQKTLYKKLLSELLQSLQKEYPQWTIKGIDLESAPIQAVITEELLDFNQALKELEHFTYHLLKHKLITHGLMWPDLRPSVSDSFGHYTKYFHHLLGQLRLFEKKNYSHTNTNQIKTWDTLLQWRLELTKKYSELLPFWNVLALCADHLSSILRGEKSIQEVLFPYGRTDLVRAFFQNQDLTKGFIHEFTVNPLFLAVTFGPLVHWHEEEHHMHGAFMRRLSFKELLMELNFAVKIHHTADKVLQSIYFETRQAVGE